MTKCVFRSFKLEKIPTIPQSLVDILKIAQDPDQDIEKLAMALNKDPTITARIYDLASTIQYRPWKKVNDLQRLIVVLGLDSVRRMIFTCAVEKIFNNKNEYIYSQLQTLWYRSLLCAHHAEELARLVNFYNYYEAYLAGLLHRIGQLILLQHAPQEYLKSIDITLEYSQVEKVEREVFGRSSLEIGAELVDTWNLPSFHADAIRFQTLPTSEVLQTTELVQILNFSQQLSCSGLKNVYVHTYTANRMFGLTEEMLIKLSTNAYAKTSQIIEGITGENHSSCHLDALCESYNQSEDALREKVKQQALLNDNNLHARSQTAGTLSTYCQSARRDLCILFGINDLYFFFIDTETHNLYGYDDTDHKPQLAQLKIGFDTVNNPLTKALANRSIVFYPDESSSHFSFFDRQLCQLLRWEELCYLPLLADKQPIGVCVIGLKPGQRHDISQQQELMLLVANQIAAQMKRAIHEDTSACPSFSPDELDYHIRTAVHEINNPLSIINTYLHILSSTVNDNNQSLQHIQFIQDEIQRVSSMVAGLRNITDPKQKDTDSVNINNLVQKITNFFQKAAFQSKDIKSSLHLDEDLPEITSQSEKIKQLIINLMKNAAEALSHQDKLSITTRDKIFSQGKMYVEIEIEDNGPGIQQEIVTNLFQAHPKPVSNHSGLGLIIVKNLVVELGGHISCASGKWGTRFQIRLPRTVAHDKGGEV